MKLESLTLSEDFRLREVEETLRQTLGSPFIALKPTLLNKYHPDYYHSKDNNFRMTVDTISAYRTAGLFSKRWDYYIPEQGLTVIEMKYDPSLDEMASEITNLLPFRVVKFSKYAIGMAHTLGE